jgi:hypothetical protein
MITEYTVLEAAVRGDAVLRARIVLEAAVRGDAALWARDRS